MTGRCRSHRGAPPSPRQRPPLTGSTLAVILDARTPTLMDLGLSDNDDTALLPALGPLITLKAQEYPGAPRANSCARAPSSQVKTPMDAAVLGRPTTETAR